MHNAGLVLEGGGLKGVYTAGVLDLLRGISIHHTWAESAGTSPY